MIRDDSRFYVETNTVIAARAPIPAGSRAVTAFILRELYIYDRARVGEFFMNFICIRLRAKQFR